MQSEMQPRQRTLFVAGCLGDLVPDAHSLKRVNAVLDLPWLTEELRDCYCADNERPGIPPESALRLMSTGILRGIAHDRKLMG